MCQDEAGLQADGWHPRAGNATFTLARESPWALGEAAMFGIKNEGERSLLSWTLRTVAAVTVLSLMAGSWLAGPGLESGALARLAALTSGGADDPMTTGSIVPYAARARLDPCVAPPSR
jgi:hypothetical protein